jgi:hypothetical protein
VRVVDKKAAWRTDPITPGQRQMLETMGLSHLDISKLAKGQASILIGCYMHEKANDHLNRFTPQHQGWKPLKAK